MKQTPLAEEVSLLHANLCAAIADPRRILILYALSEKMINVSELAEEIGISQPAASRHLKILREQGLVTPIRQGASVVYQVTDLRLIEALDLLRAVLHDQIVHRASLIEHEP